MQMPVLSVRRTAAALACAATLISLTACKGGTDAKDPASGPAPSHSAAANPVTVPNGAEKLSAAEIYAKGRETNAAAGSFREQMTRQGAKSDLLLSATECVGTVELSAKGSFEIIRKGNDVWAKPDAKLAEQLRNGTGFTISAGQWVHGAPDNPLMKSLDSWCHHEQFTAPDTLDAGTKVTKGKPTMVNGQQAVPVILASNGESVTWYTATTGKPHFVKQDSTRADMPDVVYSAFGKPVNAQAPSGQIEEAPTK